MYEDICAKVYKILDSFLDFLILRKKIFNFEYN